MKGGNKMETTTIVLIIVMVLMLGLFVGSQLSPNSGTTNLKSTGYSSAAANSYGGGCGR